MQSFDLVELWHTMGPLAKGVVLLLAAMSVYSLWVIADRAALLARSRRRSLRFVVELKGRLEKKDVDGARALAAAQPQSPVARVVHEAMREWHDGGAALAAAGPGGLADYDLVDAVHRAVERSRERELATLKRGLGGLASISSAAPFIGLFGTVVGIINAFRSMAATGQGGLGAVSAGIAEALFATAVGLAVAIPAVMAFNYFTTAIEAVAVDLNEVASELVNFLLREGKARAP